MPIAGTRRSFAATPQRSCASRWTHRAAGRSASSHAVDRTSAACGRAQNTAASTRTSGRRSRGRWASPSMRCSCCTPRASSGPCRATKRKATAGISGCSRTSCTPGPRFTDCWWCGSWEPERRLACSAYWTITSMTSVRNSSFSRRRPWPTTSTGSWPRPPDGTRTGCGGDPSSGPGQQKGRTWACSSWWNWRRCGPGTSRRPGSCSHCGRCPWRATRTVGCRPHSARFRTRRRALRAALAPSSKIKCSTGLPPGVRVTWPAWPTGTGT